MAMRLRLPTPLEERVRARARRQGAGSSVDMALRLIDAHVDDDLPAGEQPTYPTLVAPDGPLG
jgi:hypothetical protein